MWRSGWRTTAAATTGPARQPRPTSSHPGDVHEPDAAQPFSSVRMAGLRRVPMTPACDRRLSLLDLLSRRPSCAPPCPSDRAGSTAWRGGPSPTASLRSSAMVGECSGKMRSTPWPNDTLRTVNEARVPPRCRPMTTPSKTWMRSLSPSRTFTCTRTVSPDFIAGRSVSCDFSTSSIALIAAPIQVAEGRPSPIMRSAIRLSPTRAVSAVLRRRAPPSSSRSGRRSSVRASASRFRHRRISA